MRSNFHWSRVLAAVAGVIALAGCDSITDQGRDPVAAVPSTVALAGKIVGGPLASRPLVLQNNGANDRSFANTGLFSFGSVPQGSAYDISIAAQPYGWICTIGGTADGHHTGVANEDVNDLVVNCAHDPAVPRLHVSGTVANLVPGATGLVVTLESELGLESVPMASDGAFAFAAELLPGFEYTVTATSPTVNVNGTPTEHGCGVTNGEGFLPEVGAVPAPADVTNVVVSCSFTIGGAAAFPLVFGPPPAIAAPGVGLALGTGFGPPVDTVMVTSTAPFAFPSRQLSTASANYTVSITSQPPGQICVLRSGGSAVSVALTTPADVTSIGLACTNSPAPADQLTGTYVLDRGFLTFFANGTFIYGTHGASPAVPTGVEQGIYGNTGAFTPPGARTVAVTTDTNGAGGLSNAAADFGLVNLTSFTKGAGTLSFSKVATFPAPGALPTGPFSFTAVPSTAGQLTGAWVTADSFRVFVYDSATGYGFHAGLNGAVNLQDVCLIIADPAAATGSYTQDRGAGCTVPGGVVDTDPFAAFGGFYGLPGTPAAPFGSPPGTPPTASPVNYTVTAGAPDTLALQSAFGPVNWSRSVPN